HLEPWGKQVISPRTAWEMTTILREVVTKGTGKSAQFSHPVGGKTGTTNDYKDAWFIGFTPSYATGVFVGYDTPKTIYSGAAGGKVSAPIFRDFMMSFLGDKPVENFEPSAEVLQEIGAQERLNIIAQLQENPNNAGATLSSLKSNRSILENRAKQQIGDEEVLDDAALKRR
ncbi:MAG: hypothetical protein J0L55_16825, partial [Caulobacterales bacterium]|nr:hypothetical protein [Caulobacterales bacterium]